MAPLTSAMNVPSAPVVTAAMLPDTHLKVTVPPAMAEPVAAVPETVAPATGESPPPHADNRAAERKTEVAATAARLSIRVEAIMVGVRWGWFLINPM